MSPENKTNFHKFALQSVLFKGRADLYFCYVKSEKLALAIAKIFAGREWQGNSVLENLRAAAERIPGDVARLAADALQPGAVLAGELNVLSLLRLAVSEGLLSSGNADILIEEYEGLAHRLSQSTAVSLLSLEDLAVSEFTIPRLANFAGSEKRQEKYKGQVSDIKDKEVTPRTQTILDIINKNKRASIKDISNVVRDCSEKTIQRELALLIEQGRVRKEGKKRWSVYLPA
ncbi:MAG: hypothetical protein ACREGH_03020 [Minisyncoccia bacterium]